MQKYLLLVHPAKLNWPPFSDLLSLAVSFNQSFFMGMFFLISGYFVPASVEKKGSWKFMQDRLRRLGIPLLVTWFLLSPLSVAISEASKGERISDSFVKFFSLNDFYLISGPNVVCNHTYDF